MKPRLHIHTELESELVLLGGLDRNSLLAEIDQLIAYLQRAPFPVLRDVALTTGTKAHDSLSRAAIVANSIEDLMDKLLLLQGRLAKGRERDLPTKGVFLSTDLCPAPGRTVFVFPGEGSQYPDMLRELCLQFPACRSAFDDADTACALAKSSFRPSQWIFPAGMQADPNMSAEIDMAGAIQAVLAADTAFLRLFSQLGIGPDAVLGVGIGEITALECVGAMRFNTRTERLRALRDGYKLISKMSDTTRMPRCVCLSSEGPNRETLETALSPFGDDVVIARDHSVNLFGLCVRPPVADQVMEALKEEGSTVRVLPLNQPYHSPWMSRVLPHLTSFFTGLVKHEPRLPVYSCMNAAPHDNRPQTLAANAAAQWTRPLRFADTIRRLHDDGFRVFVELGARGSLTTSIKAILQDRPHLALAANRGHRSGVHQLHLTLAELATHRQEMDLSQLHINRGSKILDLARPRPTHAERIERTLPLNTALPSLRAAELPEALIAPQGPMPVGLHAQAASERPTTSDADEGMDFPLLIDAENITVSSDMIELVCKLSILDQPFLADAALGSSPVSLADSSLRGLPLMPIGMLAELMAETVRKLAPTQVVVGIESLVAQRWLTVEGSTRSIQIKAQRLNETEGGLHRFQASVLDHERAQAAEPKEAVLAKAIIILASEYTQAPQSPRVLALRGPVKLDWQGEDLYPTRLHHGPSFQNIEAIPAWGENGLVANWIALPRSSLIRRTPKPRFSLDPVLIVGMGDALTAWSAREPANGCMPLPVSFERIDFFTAPVAAWERGRMTLFCNHVDEEAITADAEVIDAEGRLLCKIAGWKNRIYQINPALHNLLLHPTEGVLSCELPEKLLAALSQEVVCCMADAFPQTLLGADDDLWLRAAAYLTLSLTERMKWREMGGTPQRRAEWLLGRIAAKDSVRSCLQKRYGRRWAAADIRIETDEAGKPCPQGEWRRHCGARMDISITHTMGHVVAAVAPNAYLGIDIEKHTRTISDDFAAAAFGATEQEIAAESGEGATALFRFWCAKEAFVKALGTGLRYGASDLLVRHYDRSSGRITVEATRLWIQAFPTLRNRPIYVHSYLLENLVLAVCVLEPDWVTKRQTIS